MVKEFYNHQTGVASTARDPEIGLTTWQRWDSDAKADRMR
jgi:hypothetical protein